MPTHWLSFTSGMWSPPLTAPCTGRQGCELSCGNWSRRQNRTRQAAANKRRALSAPKGAQRRCARVHPTSAHLYERQGRLQALVEAGHIQGAMISGATPRSSPTPCRRPHRAAGAARSRERGRAGSERATKLLGVLRRGCSQPPAGGAGWRRDRKWVLLCMAAFAHLERRRLPGASAKRVAS